LGGGINNINYDVTDGNKKYVSRLGKQIHQHHVMRYSDLLASRSAHTAGLSPVIICTEPDVTVL
tara:strand:+ start:220 stop:411 length:192 start_codon:yes stop_codon:yes gene_type:complete